MAKKSAPAPVAHHVDMGNAAANAMRGASMNVSMATALMNFNGNPQAAQEVFTPPPGTYKSKSTKQG